MRVSPSESIDRLQSALRKLGEVSDPRGDEVHGVIYLGTNMVRIRASVEPMLGGSILVLEALSSDPLGRGARRAIDGLVLELDAGGGSTT